MPESSVATAHATWTLTAEATTCGVMMLTTGAAATGPTTSVDAACGTTGFEDADAGPVPALFVAVTLNVYCVPLFRLLTVQAVEPDVVQVRPPGVDVTV